MGAIKELVITRENFLDVLGAAKVRRTLVESSKIDKLYTDLLEFLEAEKSIISMSDIDKNKKELQFRIPGTPVHIKLSGLLKKKIENFIMLSLILYGVSQDNYLNVSVGIIVGLMESFSLLRKKYGEVCIVESFGDLSKRTPNDIFIHIYNKKCKYRKSKCQFLDNKNNTCSLDVQCIEKTLAALESREVVRKKNNVEPFEWDMVF